MTPHDVVAVSHRIAQSFPDLSPEYITGLMQLMIEDQFTIDRANDAVSHVLRTCEYPRPTMAKFLGFDRSQKLYTYNEMNLFILNNHGYKTDNFERIAELNKWVMK
jgi:hypothetical protein